MMCDKAKNVISFGIALLFTIFAHASSATETKSLDGTWQIVFDHDNVGAEQQWVHDANFPRARAKAISVPSCWELVEKDYEGVAFYRHTFVVPKKFEGKVVRLHFDAVNFRAEVWLNDQAVGDHEGGFTAFEFRVDDLLKFGEENTLILRVVGPILLTDKRVDGVGPMETPQWRGAITGGIWQPVKLIVTDDLYVKDVFIEPRIADNTATFHMTLQSASKKKEIADIGITIRAVQNTEPVVATVQRKVEINPGSSRQRVTLEIPNATYWSPDRPFLYRAEVEITRNDTASDLWTTRFGMREFTIRDKRFYLNGKPLYLKATFFEGLYPLRLAYPDSREMAIREIRLAKEAGFNMIRPWRKPPPPMWLDLADEIGVLTVGSMAIECMDFPIESARLPGWVANEVRESILRDRNRACVVQWELFNELKRPVLKRQLHPMAMLARQLDPTRLILDESGGWAQGANIYLPYAYEPTKFNDIHDYPGPQINEEVYTKLLLTGEKTHEEMRAMGLKGRLPGRNVVPGLMTFFSELGYGSLPDLEDNNRRFAESGNPIAPPMVYHRRLAEQHERALKESGADEVYPSLKAFCLAQQQIHGAANRRMIEAVRSNPHVQGYCIHALTAGDWIIGAGLLDLFRNPKTYAYEGTKAANQPRIMSIRVRPRNVYAEKGTAIEITGINEQDNVKGTLSVRIFDENDTVVFAHDAPTTLVTGISQIFAKQLETNSLRGTYTIKAALVASDGEGLAENQYQFDVFGPEQLVVPKKAIAVLDPSNSLKPFLDQRGIAYEDFRPNQDRAIPVFVSKTQARNPQEGKKLDELAEFIKRGGTAVYLEGGGRQAAWGQGSSASRWLPVGGHLKIAIGLWTCIPHIVKDHPIFDGLPVNQMMGPVYENVWAQNTLMDVGGQAVVATIGFDWFPDYDRRRRHYYGPGDTWWGADVAVVPLGQGRCVTSQLRLVENLGVDPVADKIFFNLVKWTGQQNN